MASSSGSAIGWSPALLSLSLLAACGQNSGEPPPGSIENEQALAGSGPADYTQFLPPSVSPDSYDRAARLLSQNLAGTVLNAQLAPHWIAGRDEFWYRRDTASGGDYLIVDAASGEKRQAFDHHALAAAMTAGTDSVLLPTELGISSIGFSSDLLTAEIRTASATLQCDLVAYSCEPLSPLMTDPFQIISPDGSAAVFSRDGNLWLRDLADGSERALTHDSEPHFGYGALPGSVPGKLQLIRAGIDGPMMGVSWAPDGQALIVPRIDERHVGEYAFVDSIPPNGANRPAVHHKRIGLIGEEQVTRIEQFHIDLASGEQRLVPLGTGCQGTLYGYAQEVIWSGDSSKAFFLCFAADSSWFELVEYDPLSGQTRAAWREESESWIDLNHSMYQSLGSNIRIAHDGATAVIFSQRDGWGHLYHVDLTNGAILEQITDGEWVVQDMLHVDEANGWVYYAAGGRESGRNPYWRHIYRSSLDGQRTELLTPENADHQVTAATALLGAVSTFSGSRNYFIDNRSTVDTPTVSVLRRMDGSVVATLEKADPTALYELGYQPPQSFRVKAADGETDIYGVVYLPRNMQAGMKYPVIEHIYGGPQTNLTPRTFSRAAGLERIGGQGDTATMTQLGFAVVMMDVRGTPWRSKKFHDFMWRKHHEFALEDHVAALKQLGQKYQWMDLGRVGITGHSWGGFSSALAMLRFPEFYKVAVSSAGPYDYRYLYPAFIRWTGWPDFGPEFEDDSRFAPDPTARPVNLTPHSALADQLQGKLLIVYGEQDENTLPTSTISLIDALIAADKDFDMLMLPNRDHNFTNEPHFIRRRWDYFVEHLLGTDPPQGYHIKRTKQ